jgi:hypothetical protein
VVDEEASAPETPSYPKSRTVTLPSGRHVTITVDKPTNPDPETSEDSEDD